MAALVAVGVVGMLASALGCDENLHPGTTRAELCTRAGLDNLLTLASLLYALAPLLLFLGLVAFIPAARRRPLLLAGGIAAVSAVGYSIFLANVT